MPRARSTKRRRAAAQAAAIEIPTAARNRLIRPPRQPSRARPVRAFDPEAVTPEQPPLPDPRRMKFDKKSRTKLCSALEKLAKPDVALHDLWMNFGIPDNVHTPGGRFPASKMFKPATVYEIAAAIQAAEKAKTTIRAVGSGFGFSDAPLPQNEAVPLPQEIAAETVQHWRELEKFFGFGIDISNCASSLQDLIELIVPEEADLAGHFFVEAGITIDALNDLLDHQSPRLALRTMGGTSGQTLAGAISTGTHGADFDRGPLADQIQAIYLVGAGGVHHWIEPSKPITDRDKLREIFFCLDAENIHYDDELFDAVKVSMGSMGVIYACIVKVVPQFSLVSWNRWSTWNTFVREAGPKLKHGLDGSWSGINQFIAAHFKKSKSFDLKNHFLEVVVNPIANESGDHDCFVTNRVSVPLQRRASGAQPQDISQVTGHELSAAIKAAPEAGNVFTEIDLCLNRPPSDPSLPVIQQAEQLIGYAEQNGYGWMVRAATSRILQGAFPLPSSLLAVLPAGAAANASPIVKPLLQHPTPGPQIDIAHDVMTGSVIRSRIPVVSMEVGLDLLDGLLFVDAALEACRTAGSFPYPFSPPPTVSTPYGPVPGPIYPAGYISLRICGKSSALLAMQQTSPTAMIEIAMIDTDGAVGLLEIFEKIALGHAIKKAVIAPPILKKGRLHWGQSNGVMTASDVKDGYGAASVAAWKKAQKQLGGATFVNELMRRCGLA